MISPLDDVAGYRKRLGQTQDQFWPRFGVSQASGSKYESDSPMPLPISMLILAFAEGCLNEKQLVAFCAAAKKARGMK